jgi:uncharacterized protein (DUF983 family)
VGRVRTCNRCNQSRFKTIVKKVSYRCRHCGQAYDALGNRIDNRQAELIKVVKPIGGNS